MTKKLQPFKAFFYNQDRVPALKDVVSPPYDVISPEMQDELYAKSPYNFCRVDYTKEEGALRYEVAKKTFGAWLSEQILVPDKEPGLYFHFHTFVLPGGKAVTRKGFFAVRRIEEFSEGGIKPHEKTLDGPKQDRLNLMRATQMQLSPVFSLYSDPELEIFKRVEKTLKTTPFMDFTTDEGERHQVWKVKDTATADFIDSFLSAKPLFIADGHHRYETALNYRNEVLASHPNLPDNAGVRHILMYFSNMDDDGLVILPIHRALHSLRDFDLDAFLSKLSGLFTVREAHGKNTDELTAELAALGELHHAYLILTKDERRSYLAFIERDKWLTSAAAARIPFELAGLDVTVLHRHIFEELLGISEASQARQENIVYLKSTETAVAEAGKGRSELTFILNPTRITDMRDVAGAGYKMPQKSTFFYPKIVSGLFLHDVRENAVDGI